MKQIITNKNHNNVRFALVLLFIFLLCGVYFALKSYRLVSTGVVDHGIIVDSERKTSSCSGDRVGRCYTYSSIVEYSTSEGNKNRFTSALRTPNSPQIGQEVKIIYNPDKLGDIEIYDFKSLWLLPILLLAFSLLGMTIIFFTRNKKYTNAPPTKSQVKVSMKNGNPKVEAMSPGAEKIAQKMQNTADKYKDLFDKF